MELSSYSLSADKKINSGYSCSICLDDNLDKKLTKIDCNHIFHSECVTKYIENKINDKSEKIICPLEDCETEISDETICSLIKDKEDLLLEFKKNKISYNINYCLCNNCKSTFCEKKNGKFIDYCAHCKTTHCFQCGKNHSVLLNCFEMDMESKKIIYEFYKDTNFVLKTCPHCDLPQEKGGGCDSMICGQNTENEKLKIQGCKKSFDWKNAEIFNFEYDIENQTDLMKEVDIKIEKAKLLEKKRTRSIVINNCRPYAILFLIIALIIIVTKLSIVINNIIAKHNRERRKHCNTEFKFVDKNFIDQSCLNKNNLIISEYQDCHSELFCWNYGDNVYNNMCYDKQAAHYSKICKQHNIFNKHSDVFYCNNLSSYKGIYACDKNASKYYLIIWVTIMFTISVITVVFNFNENSNFKDVYFDFIISFFATIILFGLPILLSTTA
jgi:hypothetical protein